MFVNVYCLGLVISSLKIMHIDINDFGLSVHKVHMGFPTPMLCTFVLSQMKNWQHFWSAGKCHMWRHKIRHKRRIATSSWKGNQLLTIKTAIERLIFKLGYPNFRWNFYFILFLVASLLFRRIIMTSHMTLSSASKMLSIFHLT